MPIGDHPLTHPERSPIFALQSTGRSQRPMAEPLGRAVSPISQELSRHRGQWGDRPQQAQGKAMSRRRAASAVPWKMTPERWAVVEDRLQAGLEPGAHRGPVSATRGRDGWSRVNRSVHPGGPTGGYQLITLDPAILPP